MIDQETLAAMALTQIHGLSQRQALQLYRATGSAATCLSADSRLLEDFVSDYTGPLANIIQQSRSEALERAQQEAEFDESHGICPLALNDEAYPALLRECEDAPLVLYYRGNADLNVLHTIAFVGTRRCTEYGKDLCQRLICEVSQECPDALIVSGLAYGIDINSHRAALQNGLLTIGVLAHGLDQIYPSTHRSTATEMLEHGGLLTEYMTKTQPVAGNFVRRNRIVAGLSRGCVVIESRERGGALITAQLAQDYGRDVMAVPGRTSDAFSQGCNHLIQSNVAALVSSGTDIIQTLGWETLSQKDSRLNHPVETNLFQKFTEEERTLIDLLRDSDGKQINILTVQSKMPVQRVSSILFELEMHGVVKLMPGGRYRLLK